MLYHTWDAPRAVPGCRWTIQGKGAALMATQDPYAAQLQQAYQLIQQGEREQALAILYGVVTGAPLHRDAWWLIAQAATNTRQREQALRRALEIDPTFEPARRMLARLSQMNVPTEPGGTAQPPEAPAGSPPSGPLPYAPPPPAPNYGRPFEQARSPFEAEPTMTPPSPPRRERPPPRSANVRRNESAKSSTWSAAMCSSSWWSTAGAAVGASPWC